MAITSGQTASASDFVATPSGAGDSGKVPKLDSGGKIPSGFAVHYPGTQVFSGTTPTSMTDLDVSAVVGAKKCLVVLKFTQGTATNIRIGLRAKGDTETYPLSPVTYGANTGAIVSNVGDAIYLIVDTNTSGVLQWTTSNAQSMTVNVVAYI